MQTMTTNNVVTGENDTDKPYNMGLARRAAKDVLFGLSRKHRRAKEEGRELTLEDEEKYAMGKIYDVLLILTNHLAEPKKVSN